MRILLLCGGVAIALLLGPASGRAQAPGEPAPAETAPKKRTLTPEEIAEKESRKACKIRLCTIFRGKQPEGENIACDIVKTWREQDIAEMISGGRLDWPWGKAKCTTRLELDRAPLVKAVTEPSYELSVPSHAVTCELDRKSEGKIYRVTVNMAPKVTFENGKAVAGSLNWGEVEAPMLAYGVVWPATGIDNQTNVLGGQLVKLVNEFLTSKCDEVKDELPGAARTP